MKSCVYIFEKILLKAVSLACLGILFPFHFVFNVFSAVYRFICVPLGILGIFYSGCEIFLKGFSTYYGIWFAIFAAMIPVRSLLPVISYKLTGYITALVECILEPVMIKPPVRYTM